MGPPGAYVPFIIVFAVGAGLYLVVRVISSAFFEPDKVAAATTGKAEAAPDERLRTGVEVALMARADHQAALEHAAQDRLRSAFQRSDRAALALIRRFDARDFAVCRQLPEILGSLLEWALKLRSGVTSAQIADEMARLVAALPGERDAAARELLNRFVAVIVQCSDQATFTRIVEKIALARNGIRIAARIVRSRERLGPSGKIRIG